MTTEQHLCHSGRPVIPNCKNPQEQYSICSSFILCFVVIVSVFMGRDCPPFRANKWLAVG
eukprot:3701450-Amphidinium_carterae.1